MENIWITFKYYKMKYLNEILIGILLLFLIILIIILLINQMSEQFCKGVYDHCIIMNVSG